MLYKDVPETRWDYGSIAAVTGKGLMGGYPDGSFHPDEPLKRGELASVLHRLMFRDGLFDDILSKVMPSIVLVHRGDAFGSGCCIAAKGGVSYVVTNAHVVGDKQQFTLIREWSTDGIGWLVAKDAKADLALLKTDLALPPLEIETQVALGQPVAVVGSPKGYTESVTVGIISNLRREHTDGKLHRFQLDAPINPGNSGGPVINEYGRVIGVAVAKVVSVDTEGIGFAIRPELVKEFIAGKL